MIARKIKESGKRKKNLKKFFKRKKGYKNKSRIKTIVIDGVEKPIMEWYEEYCVTGPTVAYRMKKYGLTFEDALKMPKITMGRPRKEV